MKALVIHDYGAPQNARIEDIERPAIKSDELLVQIRAAGVNPFDYKVVTGSAKAFMKITFPYIPGTDGAGVVVESGDGVEGWRVGSRSTPSCAPPRKIWRASRNL